MANESGISRSTARYGWSGKGTRVLVGPIDIGASEVFTDTGGKFVVFDGSRRVEVAASGDGTLLGWADCGAFTASSTEGGDNVMVDVSTESAYWIPADATVDATMRGKTCDLIVSSDVQYADVGESNEDVIRIIDVDITNQRVLVQLVHGTIYATGIA